MSALILDILIEQGATFQREFTVKSKGLPLTDFANYTPSSMLRTSKGVFAVSFIATVTGPTTVLIELDATVTATLPAAKTPTHKYDVKVQSPSGIVYRIAQGRVTISEQETHS